MVGITLSPEQIKSAPPEVRQWQENQIAASLGPEAGLRFPNGPQRLGVCTPQEAEATYISVRDTVPVVNVFFELGREGVSIDQEGVEAFRLVDMLRHTRLAGMHQLGACLQMIDQTFREIHDDNETALLVVDLRGYCIVAADTQRNILALWTQLVAAQRIAQPDAAGSTKATLAQASAPFITSGTVPPSSIHLNGAFPGVTVQSSFGTETIRS
ncbi:hypothetical protein AAAK29_25985 [Mesorhizobium sp. CCNWLW179-1]|uniref:hypothetical protein n=1 Tax=unclassified Mesorhizobium TaxID=325217 RepID=UPI0030141E5A